MILTEEENYLEKIKNLLFIFEEKTSDYKKILNLLFLFDAKMFEETGRPSTNLSYQKEESITVVALPEKAKLLNEKIFSKRELKVLAFIVTCRDSDVREQVERLLQKIKNNTKIDFSTLIGKKIVKLKIIGHN